MKKPILLLFIMAVISTGSVLFLNYSLNSLSEKSLSEEKEPPNDWFFQQRAYPYDDINYEAYKEALFQAKSLREIALRRENSVAPSWKFAGPVNVGGRITDIEMHTSDLQTIYAASAQGGVFKSSDGGTSWKPIFDNELSLSIGDIAIAPSNPQVLYVGTGEANGGGGSTTNDGIGMFKSMDGGSSWKYLGLDKIRNTGRVVVDPKNENRVFVAGMGPLYSKSPDRGVYRSTDGGATWKNVLYVSDSTGAIDIVIHPKNPDTLYAAMWERVRTLSKRTYGGPTCNIYRTYDGGNTWTKLAGGLPASSSNIGRIGLAIAESSPNIVYAVYADKTGNFAGVFKTTTNGNSWTRVNDGALQSMFSSYGWWFGRIHVDPTDPNVVYGIGFNLYKSSDGGNSWAQVASSVHVDHHSVYIHPKNPKLVLNGNDGGVYISKDAGSSWSHVRNLPITQFYTCEVDYKNPSRLYGGAQDNSVIRTLTGSLTDWSSIVGGDGFVALVDPANNSYVYGESQNGALRRSTNGGSSFSDATSGIGTSDRTNWNTPVIFDPTNPQILYYGSNKLYKSTDRAVSWTAISQDLTKGNGGSNVTLGTITCIAVAPSNPSVIYAGTDDGNIWRTSNAGTNWTKISSALPVRWVTRVAIHPKDPLTAYVTLSGYRKNEYLPHIFQTTDGGSNWKDISGNLPDAPINEVIVDPIDNTTLYIGTDIGVFVGNSQANWSVLGSGLPNVPVMDLTLHHPTRTLVAGTFGRSMYTYDLSLATSVPLTASATGALKIYPNPCIRSATLKFELDADQQHTEVAIFDLSGKQIVTLYDGMLHKGTHSFVWEGKSISGNVASGTYICRVITNTAILSQKIQFSNR